MQSSAADHRIDEWTQARNVISGFDDRLDGLRKAGFSLIATLLTAEGLLLPGAVTSTSSLPDPAKFAVLLATLFLVAGMEVVDRTYRGIQEAAATRASILERNLNMELTDTISARFSHSQIGWAVFGAYGSMGAAVLVLGSIVLDPSGLFWVLVLVFLAWLVVSNLLQIDYGDHGPVDWSLSGQSLSEAEAVTITVTNLSPEKRWGWSIRARVRHWPTHLSCSKGQIVWQLEVEGTAVGGQPVLVRRAEADLELPPQQDFVWQLSLTSLPPGLSDGTYQIRPVEFRGDGSTHLWPEALRRKLTLSRSKEMPTEARSNQTDNDVGDALHRLKQALEEDRRVQQALRQILNESSSGRIPRGGRTPPAE